MKQRSQIEAYFRNEMNELEKLSFMETVNADPELLKEFNVMKSKVLEIQLSRLQQELHVIHSSALNEAKSSNIKSVYDIGDEGNESLKPPTYSTSEKPSRKGYKKGSKNNKTLFLLIAAAFLVGAIYFGMGLFSTDEKVPDISVTETKELYETYFSPDPGLNIDPRDLSNVKFNAAMVDYKNKKYSDALMQWQEIEKNASSDTLHFYIGQSLLGLDQASEAQNEFAKIPQSSIFSDKALYYSALAQVKQGYSKEAVDVLENSLSQMNNEAIKSRSQSLLDDLKQKQ